MTTRQDKKLTREDRNYIINIFITDDDKEFRSFLCDVLSRKGFSITGEACNGVEALNTLVGTSVFPDVIIMDADMPVLNGLEAARSILRTRPQANIIFLGDETMTDQELQHYGITNFISKQLPLDQLVTKLLSTVIFTTGVINSRKFKTFDRGEL